MNKQIRVKDMLFEEMISEAAIQKRITEIGVDLHTEYRDKQPIFIGILCGAFMFMADLVRAVDVECEIEFVKLSSYKGMNSTGKINVELDLKIDITDRHIIIAEDIVDTGYTLKFFMDRLQGHKPASIKLVSLLEKPTSIKYDIQSDIVGFSIPNNFVIGYGLDFDGKCRQLDSIYHIVDPQV